MNLKSEIEKRIPRETENYSVVLNRLEHVPEGYKVEFTLSGKTDAQIFTRIYSIKNIDDLEFAESGIEYLVKKHYKK